MQSTSNNAAPASVRAHPADPPVPSVRPEGAPRIRLSLMELEPRKMPNVAWGEGPTP